MIYVLSKLNKETILGQDRFIYKPIGYVETQRHAMMVCEAAGKSKFLSGNEDKIIYESIKLYRKYKKS